VKKKCLKREMLSQLESNPKSQTRDSKTSLDLRVSLPVCQNMWVRLVFSIR